MRRFTWLAGLFCWTALLVGCSSGAPSFPAYSTMDQALGKVLKQQVAIAYDEEFGANRRLVLFRTDRNPGLSPTLLERTDWGWRMTSAVGLRKGLTRLGALTYDRGSIGRVKEKHGNLTTERAEAVLVYGEALDPGITWVELTLDKKGAEPIRATVKDGLWLVRLPPENQFGAFDLRAGDANGRRFAAIVGIASVNHRELDPATAPLVEYQDLQAGLRLQYPAVAGSPRIDENGRLVLSFSPWTITVERKPVQGNQSLAEQLKAAVGDGQLLEEGTRPLGVHQAAFLLESRPEADGQGSVFHAHYLVQTGGSTYAVTCSTTRVFSHGFWAKNLLPVCERVLTTISLGAPTP